MRVEQLEEGESRSQLESQSIEKSLRLHRIRIHEFTRVHRQLKCLSLGVDSAELGEAIQAGNEAERELESERRLLAETRERLLRENSELQEICERGLHKSQIVLEVNPIFQQIKAEGQQWISEALGAVGLPMFTSREIQQGVANSMRATQKHHARLEKVHKKLEQARNRLEKLSMD